MTNDKQRKVEIILDKVRSELNVDLIAEVIAQKIKEKELKKCQTKNTRDC